MYKKENGFGALEFILLLLFTGLIAGAGWYVLRTQNNNDSSTANTQTLVDSEGNAALQNSSGYSIYDTNPNFSVEYPRSWSTETSGDDSSNQYISFHSPDFQDSGDPYSDNYSVSNGAQFQVWITNEGLPPSLKELQILTEKNISNYEQIYATSGMKFQKPQILKTTQGVEYMSFVGHSSLISPFNNSANSYFISGTHGIALSYYYPTRTDTELDPTFKEEFAHLIDSLVIE